MKTIDSIEIFGIAGRDATKTSDRAPVKISLWNNVAIWDRQEEALRIHKGDFVRVVGKLRHSEWTAPDGTKRTGTEVVADSFEILPRDSQKPITEKLVAPLPAPKAPRAQGGKSFVNAHGVEVSDDDIGF